jgi:hypothetical protein
MKRSTAPIDTGSLRLLRMHEPSHSFSCGHTREHSSGMLLVERDTSAASMKRPCAASSSHSGMRFESGHDCRQRGSGHWIQRAAWACTVASSKSL